MTRGEIHHVELWVPDLGRVIDSLGWMLRALGYTPFQDWVEGRSWRLGDTYIVIEQSPALTAHIHDRYRPGLNHLALHAGTGDLGQVLARIPRLLARFALCLALGPASGGAVGSLGSGLIVIAGGR